jgi:hypothetical protein
MAESRRDFLTGASVLMAAAAACDEAKQKSGAELPPAGAPPAFGTSPEVGPPVSTATFAEAEKLVQFELKPEERQQGADSWRKTMAALYERRTGPRKFAPDASTAPATLWNPMLPGLHTMPGRNRFVRSEADSAPLPANDADIAYASLAQLSRWIESRQLTSERLTHIYLDRIERFDSKLRCIITLTRDQAVEKAKKADAEMAAGRYRGPLHGVPFGVKDLLDTAGIATTWGAEPYRNRLPQQDSAVVKRLYDAGAVLIAKLSLGALALNDIWFGGQTMNPWLLEEGASGSSAGPGAATAAGLVGFSIGSETGGSIVSPSAVRRDRIASDLRARTANGRDDAVLVAGQTGSDDAGRGRRDVGSPSDLRPGRGRFRERSFATGFRLYGTSQRFASWLLSRLDEGDACDRSGPCSAGDDPQTRDVDARGVTSGLAVRLLTAHPFRRGSGRF